MPNPRRVKSGTGRPRILWLLLVISTVLFPLLTVRPASANSVILTANLSNMLLDPARPRAYLLDQGSGSVIVWNTTSDREIGRISLGQGPSGQDISQDGNELYVVVPGSRSLDVINLATLTLAKNITLSAAPHDVAAGRQGRAYLTLSQPDWSSPLIVDTSQGREIGRINDLVYSNSIARRSPDRTLLFIGITGLSPAQIFTYSIATDNPTRTGSPPYGDLGSFLVDIAIDPDGVYMYVTAGAPYYVQIWSYANWTFVGGLDTGPYPGPVDVAGASNIAFGTHRSNELMVFNTTTRTLIQTYYATQNIIQIRSEPDASKFYVLTSSTLEVFMPPSWRSNSQLTISNLKDSSVTLAWTPATSTKGISSYRVYSGANLLGTVQGSSLSFDATGLAPATMYTFTVYPVGVDSDSGLFGLSASATTLPDSTPPTWSPGSTLAVSSLTSTSLALSWSPATDNAGISGYRVFKDGVAYDNTCAFCTYSYVSGLQPETSYTFRVEAGDGSNNWSTNGPTTTVQTPKQSPPIPPGTRAELRYAASSTGRAYPGGTVTIQNSFTNTGQYRVSVTNIVITSDLGTFEQATGLPLTLEPTQTKTAIMTANIPSTARPGNHTLTATINWQVYVNGSWYTADPITASGVLPVQTSNSPLDLIRGISILISMLPRPILATLAVGLVIYVSLVVAAVVMLKRSEENQRKKLLAMPIQKQA